MTPSGTCSKRQLAVDGETLRYLKSWVRSGSILGTRTSSGSLYGKCHHGWDVEINLMLENCAKTFGQPWGSEIFLRIIRMRKKNKARFMPYSDAVSKTFLRHITLVVADKRL